MLRTRQAFGNEHSTADPLAVKPWKLRQCQHGRATVDHGVKWVARCMVWMMRRGVAEAQCAAAGGQIAVVEMLAGRSRGVWRVRCSEECAG